MCIRPWPPGSAQPFLVFGLLTTGLAWGHHINALEQLAM